MAFIVRILYLPRHTHINLCEELVQLHFSSHMRLAAICRIAQCSDAASTRVLSGTTTVVYMPMRNEVLNFSKLSTSRYECFQATNALRPRSAPRPLTALPSTDQGLENAR